MFPECCAMMSANCLSSCDQHPNRTDCPDIIMHKYESGYGIPIHDGGDSYIEIFYCPWCGVELVR